MKEYQITNYAFSLWKILGLAVIHDIHAAGLESDVFQSKIWFC